MEWWREACVRDASVTHAANAHTICMYLITPSAAIALLATLTNQLMQYLQIHTKCPNVQ